MQQSADSLPDIWKTYPSETSTAYSAMKITNSVSSCAFVPLLDFASAIVGVKLWLSSDVSAEGSISGELANLLFGDDTCLGTSYVRD
jgi:hypothetical protein